MAAEAGLLPEAVDLQPIGRLVPGTLSTLAARLSRTIQLPCQVLPERELATSHVPGRDQLDAAALLEALEAHVARANRLLVGVAATDIAIPIFTFVFGLARQGGRVCVVSLARADPGFYGLPADEELRDRRAVAEILHELGHLAALGHCFDGGCLMSFAGTIEKADARGTQFCPSCAARLPAWMRQRETAGSP